MRAPACHSEKQRSTSSRFILWKLCRVKIWRDGKGKRDSLTINALDSKSSGLGSNPGRRHCDGCVLGYDTKHLMTGPEGNSEFLGNKIHCSPRDQTKQMGQTGGKEIITLLTNDVQKRSTFGG